MASTLEDRFEAVKQGEFCTVVAMYVVMVEIDHYHPIGLSHVHRKFIVGAGLKSVVTPIALVHARERWGHPTELHIYPRTYRLDARRLALSGEWVDVDQ